MRISDWSSDVCSSDLRHRSPAFLLSGAKDARGPAPSGSGRFQKIAGLHRPARDDRCVYAAIGMAVAGQQALRDVHVPRTRNVIEVGCGAAADTGLDVQPRAARRDLPLDHIAFGHGLQTFTHEVEPETPRVEQPP